MLQGSGSVTWGQTPTVPFNPKVQALDRHRLAGLFHYAGNRTLYITQDRAALARALAVHEGVKTTRFDEIAMPVVVIHCKVDGVDIDTDGTQRVINHWLGC